MRALVSAGNTGRACYHNDYPASRGSARRKPAHLADGLYVTTAECCTSDTPRTSLSKVSRSRQTTDQLRCFVVAWLMLSLRKWSVRRWPRRISQHPPRAWGPRLLRRKYPVPVLRRGSDCRNKTPIPRQGGHHKGTEAASGCPTAWNRTRKGLRKADQAFRWRKSGLQLKYCWSVATLTLGREVVHRGRGSPVPILAAPRCWRDGGP